MGSSSRTPALSPPPGVTPNFVNPSSKAQELYTTGYVFFGITTAGVIARLYTVAFVMKKIHFEDYTLIVGWLGVLAFMILGALMEPVLGRHQWDVSGDQIQHFPQQFSAVQITYEPTMCLLKLAILFQLKRIFAGARRNLTWLAFQALIWLNILFFTIILIFTSARCIPRAKLASSSINGVCFDYRAILLGTSSFNTVSDFLVLLLPLYIVSRLSISTKQKIGIMAVFALGFLGCIASASRIYFIKKLFSTQDMTYAILPVGFTAGVELFSALLVACSPMMPAFYQHIRQKIQCRRTQTRLHSNPRTASPPKMAVRNTTEKAKPPGPLNQNPSQKNGVTEVQQSWLVNYWSASVNDRQSTLERPAVAVTKDTGVSGNRRTGKRVREIRFHARDIMDNES